MYAQSLRQLTKSCKFEAATATIHNNKAIQDAFITGLSSNGIQQRLLEDENLDLAAAIAKARTLESAQRNSKKYRATMTNRIEESAATGDSISANGDFISKSQASVPQNNNLPVICVRLLKSPDFSWVWHK